jgi:hypothetical protein
MTSLLSPTGQAPKKRLSGSNFNYGKSQLDFSLTSIESPSSASIINDATYDLIYFWGYLVQMNPFSSLYDDGLIETSNATEENAGTLPVLDESL